jgi:hypothetical protein
MWPSSHDNFLRCDPAGWRDRLNAAWNRQGFRMRSKPWTLALALLLACAGLPVRAAKTCIDADIGIDSALRAITLQLTRPPAVATPWRICTPVTARICWTAWSPRSTASSTNRHRDPGRLPSVEGATIEAAMHFAQTSHKSILPLRRPPGSLRGYRA